MLTSAVIGLGWWGRHIVTSLSASEKIKVTHVADIAIESHLDFVRENDLNAFKTLDEVLHDDSIQLVILCTPNRQHTTQIAACAKAGKHVFCEKPLALTRAAAEESVRVCKAHGVKLGVGHERRFEAPIQAIERMVRNGEFGTVMHAEANFSHNKLANVPSTDWRRNTLESPAAGMTAMGVHLSDAFLNLFGSVTCVMATTSARCLPGDNGDVVSAMLRHETGMVSYISSILATPLYLRLAIFGTAAWAECRNQTHPDTPGPSTLTVTSYSGETETTTFGWVDTVQLNLDHFADYIAGRSAYLFSDAQLINNIAVLEAVAKSSRTGSEVLV